jgi:hypothetical protein
MYIAIGIFGGLALSPQIQGVHSRQMLDKLCLIRAFVSCELHAHESCLSCTPTLILQATTVQSF